MNPLKWVKCPHCHGRRLFWRDGFDAIPCHVCLGKGIVVVKK